LLHAIFQTLSLEDTPSPLHHKKTRRRASLDLTSSTSKAREVSLRVAWRACTPGKRSHYFFRSHPLLDFFSQSGRLFDLLVVCLIAPSESTPAYRRIFWYSRSLDCYPEVSFFLLIAGRLPLIDITKPCLPLLLQTTRCWRPRASTRSGACRPTSPRRPIRAIRERPWGARPWRTSFGPTS
jgi:hypothetical protein